MFHHVVTFSLKAGADRLATAERLRSLGTEVESLQHIEVGVDVGGTPRSVDIALITRFADEEGYRAYANHPFHLDVLAHMGTVVDRVAVVDWSD